MYSMSIGFCKEEKQRDEHKQQEGIVSAYQE